MRPKFVSLTPVVLDVHRVTLQVETKDFPPKTNISLVLDDAFSQPDKVMLDQATTPLEQSPMASNEPVNFESLYPHVELSILDDQNQIVADTFIVEHQETMVALTLYLRRPSLGQTYTAQAMMLHQDECIDTIRTPFILKLDQS